MKNVFMISLGCDKNLVDSEGMYGQLLNGGYQLVDAEEEADVIIVNTCCFIDDAKEESIESILSVVPYRTEGNCKALVVTGCLAERYRSEILEEIPEVDAVLGTKEYAKITSTVAKLLGDESQSEEINIDPAAFRKNRASGGSHYSYLKIAEGCDKCCTYCIIPKVRGHYVSFPMEELIEEAKRLADDGTQELIIVAQETTRYGVDLYGRKMLPELLQKLSEIEGIRWIRLLYCYPEEITDELIQMIKQNSKICHYLDIPIQHASDGILKRMGRRTNQDDLNRIIEKLRGEIPDIALRTTLITGFPGETEEQHEEVISFIRKHRFERLGIFRYSREEDTPAAGFEDQISDEVKEKRYDELMSIQQEIAFDQTESLIGETMEVIVDGRLPEEGVYIARTYRDTPDVDSYLFFPSSLDLMSGTFVTVRVTAANEYDLIGELIDETE